MIIRKLFGFENAHIVRFCGSKKCRTSIHGHSYKCEVLLHSNFLDNAGMVFDFGYMKLGIKDIVESFDHATTIFSGDDEEYIRDIKKHSLRWIEIPLNPSAEQFCRIFFVLIDRLLSLINMQNGEREITLHSIIVHETDTGYAQCFREDAYNKNMGEIRLDEIKFSPEVMAGWSDEMLFEKLKNSINFTYPKDC